MNNYWSSFWIVGHYILPKNRTTLAKAAIKLRVKQELHRIIVILGGGGYCDNPYRRGVFAPFSGLLFSHPINPEIFSVPPPHDPDLQDF